MSRLASWALAAVALGALAWSVTSRADGGREIRGRSIACSTVYFKHCQLLHGPKGPPDTPAARRAFDAVVARCRAAPEYDAWKGYSIPDNPRIGLDPIVTARELGNCQACKDRYGTPGPCPPGGTAAAGSTFGGASYGGVTYGDLDARTLRRLGRCFHESVQAKRAEGHAVRTEAWLASGADPKQSRRANDYGTLGIAWIGPCVEPLYKDAVIDEIVVEEAAPAKSPALDHHAWRRTGASALVWSPHHRATRIVLPDGRRYVVDYWEGISTGTGRLQTEGSWSQRWRANVDAALGPESDATVRLAPDQRALADAVKKHGADKGVAVYRKAAARKKGAKPDTWIASFRRQPW